MSNSPLIAQRQDTTGDWTGIGIAESIGDLRAGFESGSWIDATIGGVATSMEALSFCLDPLGSLVSWGVAYLIEHCKPLSDALDWLAGDPDQITAYAGTWTNVSKAIAEASAGLADSARGEAGTWIGEAGDAYRAFATRQAQGLTNLAEAAAAMSAITTGAALLVALVRELVRDLIADFVAILAVRIWKWAAETAATLGAASVVVVAEVSALVAKWAAKIGRLLTGLIRTISNLAPILRRLQEIIDKLKTVWRQFRDNPYPDYGNQRYEDVNVTGSRPPAHGEADWPPEPADLNDAPPWDGTPAGPDPLAPWDPASGDPIPPRITDGPTMPTKELAPRWQGEDAPPEVNKIWKNGQVEYLYTAAEREQHRLVVSDDGRLYTTAGLPFDTPTGGNRAIFVVDEHGNLYATAQHSIGEFHHSSFLAGEPVAGAGEMVVRDGWLETLSDQSGHYQPSRDFTERVVDVLRGRGLQVDDDQIKYRLW